MPSPGAVRSTQDAWLFIVPMLLLLLFPFLLVPLLLPRKKEKRKSLRIAFVHPDLGIGGAERLVVDAAVALQSAGHKVCIYTARHEPSHCFEETRDGTLEVLVFGAFLPRRILGRFYAACAYTRMMWVAMRIMMKVLSAPYDVLIVDQVSVCLPILAMARAHGIIFYCHYPDYLLTQHSHSNPVKRLYRAPLDFMEEQTTGMADIIFVNSNFTAGVFAEAFPSLTSRGVVPSVLYPALNLEEQDKKAMNASASLKVLTDGEFLLISVNRFERKKNVGLAIRAFAALPEALRNGSRLVLAGGYDERLPENVEHAAELQALAKTLGVAGRVTQMRSVSAADLATLLQKAACLLYTPDREHFGIVPLEAMYARVPVLAVNSGGPLESIVDGETGFLRPPEPAAWAEAIQQLLEDGARRRRLGEAGRQRVAENFSLEVFGKRLDSAVRSLAEPKDRKAM